MEQELRAPWPFDSAGLGENTLQLCRPSVVVSSDSRHLKRALRSSALRQGTSASALTEVFTSHCITQSFAFGSGWRRHIPAKSVGWAAPPRSLVPAAMY